MDIQSMTRNELYEIISRNSLKTDDTLLSAARSVCDSYYGKDIYIRGLIEFTNICKNNCYYCGLRRDNSCINRYRLSKSEILSCVDSGLELGFSTFVLQGGEDMHYNDKVLCDLVYSIKEKNSECAVTLSVGERSYDSYKALRDAGADRYLLRHETADKRHYEMLHPSDMSYDNRIRCLYDLKELGYQVGAGFMVGSPYQTFENLADDLLFLKKLEPDMIGIGPFIPQSSSPFAKEKQGELELTLTMISLTRLMLPNALIPATTALGTIDENGREKGIAAGANVLMPNLSPPERRGDYSLYDNKLCTGAEAAENLAELKKIVDKCGYTVNMQRGDVKK